jgi:hypothetical protein
MGLSRIMTGDHWPSKILSILFGQSKGGQGMYHGASAQDSLMSTIIGSELATHPKDTRHHAIGGSFVIAASASPGVCGVVVGTIELLGRNQFAARIPFFLLLPGMIVASLPSSVE